MGQHYTKRTVEAASWCKKCGRETAHRVDGVKLGPCLECIARLEEDFKKAGIPVHKRKGESAVTCNMATWNYLNGPRPAVIVGPYCNCLSFRFPHEIRRHLELRADWDWRKLNL